MSGSRPTESLPLSLALIAAASIVAIAVDRGGRGPNAGRPQARAAAGLQPAAAAHPSATAAAAPWPSAAAPLRPAPAEPSPGARGADGRALRRHAALRLLLRLADPALAARIEGTAGRHAVLTSTELAQLDRVLERAGASPEAFLEEEARLAASPARRASVLALIDEWHDGAASR